MEAAGKPVACLIQLPAEIMHQQRHLPSSACINHLCSIWPAARLMSRQLCCLQQLGEQCCSYNPCCWQQEMQWHLIWQQHAWCTPAAAAALQLAPALVACVNVDTSTSCHHPLLASLHHWLLSSTEGSQLVLHSRHAGASGCWWQANGREGVQPGLRGKAIGSCQWRWWHPSETNRPPLGGDGVTLDYWS